MKKLLFALMLLFILPIESWSQHYAVIGTGTSTTNDYLPDPVERVWEYEHIQFVYTSADFLAAGMVPGSSIVGLGFSISESADLLTNYSISLGNTSQSIANPYISDGLVTVKGSFTYNPTLQAGGSFDMIAFDSPFVWDGSSNIVVNICTGPNIVTVPYGGLRCTTSPQGSVRTIRSASENCLTATNSNTIYRPNIQFEFLPPPPCTGAPAPGNTLSTMTTVCPGITFNLSLQNFSGGSGISYAWESSPDGIIWSATGASSAQYATTQNFPTWYRCKVSCSGNTGTSAPILISMNIFYNCYCPSRANNPGEVDIFSVTLNGSTNSYNCSTVAPGTGSLLNMYSNFYPLGSLCDLPQTVTVPFSMLEDECDGAPYNIDGCAIWIDYNHDGDFDDIGEQVFVETYTAMGPRTIHGNFLVPSTAVPGITGMRMMSVIGYSGASLIPCLTYGYGETEDYFVTITAPPPCPNPAVQTTSNITSTSATINWTNGGSENQWNVIYGPSGFNPSNTGIQISGVTTRSYTLDQLTPSTSYDWYVQSVCTTSNSVSILTGPFNFKTPCSPVTTISLPWTENFDNMTTIGNNILPACWAAISPSGTPWSSGNASSSSDSDPCSSPNYTYVSWIPLDLEKFLITPGFDLKTGIPYEFRFKWAGDGFLGWTGDVLVNSVQSVTGAKQLGASFVTPNIPAPTNCSQASRIFVPPVNGTYYFMVRVSNTLGPIELGFDDFLVMESDACAYPVNLSTTPGTTQVMLGWTTSAAMSWDTEYGPVPYTFTGTPTITGAANPQSITGLTPGTQYTCKVRAFCGDGNYSAWSDPLIFTTDCLPSPAPFIQDFSSSTFPPLCWSRSTATQQWKHDAAASGYGTGNGSAYANFYTYSAGIQFDLMTLTFNASLLSNPLLIFDHAYATLGAAVDKLRIYTSADAGASYTLMVELPGGMIGPLNTAGSKTSSFTPLPGEWATKSYSLPTGTNKIKFTAISAYGNNLYLDNVRVEESSVPVNQNITGTVGPSQTMCYNATDTLKVAGTGVFKVQEDGSATMIAGKSVKFFPGASVDYGGYMHAYISTIYCQAPTAPVIAGNSSTNSSVISTNDLFILYPNPTTGGFTIFNKDLNPDVITNLEIYTLSGMKLLSTRLTGQKNEVSLDSEPSGIYIVKLISGQIVVNMKLVKIN